MIAALIQRLLCLVRDRFAVANLISWALTVDMANTTLMATMKEAIELCKDDTIALFAEEGETITRESLPDSLLVYLQSQETEVADVRTESAVRLRKQIEEFHSISADAPAVALQDITVRCSCSVCDLPLTLRIVCTNRREQWLQLMAKRNPC